MSSKVDNRVVELGFDNKQFESGVKTSVSTLDTLKKSLNFEQASKSLLNLGTAGKNFSLSHIADNVQNVSNKFSALGVIGFTVLQNLTNAAISYGKKIVNGLVSPIMTGLTEYETQLNAIQTILANTASKGTNLEQVNAALDELNAYSDKTIYNFTEMTRNIGTFTAAGVDLDTSVSAIKGIANLAAVSGSNSQQAATAMYQLSQALSSGTVRLMDWNSVVNAGMGGEVFKNALMETARVHGVAIDDMIKDEGSFRDSLQAGWLTSDILTETLSKFTGDLNEQQLKTMGYTEEQIASIIKLGQTANDAATKVKTFSQLKQTLMEAIQSGWAQSWRIVMGDFEEAKSFFTEVSDILGAIITSSSEARNKVLQDWKDAGGRVMLIDSLKNAFEGFLSIIAPIKEAFTDIFGPGISGKNLLDITKALFQFTEKLKISGETADQIKRIFSGLFAALDIVRDVVVTLIGAFFDLTSAISPSGSSILEFLARIGDSIVKFREGIDISKIFQNALEKIGYSYQSLRDKIIEFSNVVKERFESIRKQLSDTFENVDTSGMETFFDKLKIRFAPFTNLFKGLGFILKGFVTLAKKVGPIFFKLAVVIGNFFAGLGTALLEGLENVDFTKVFDVINSGLIAAILLAIKKFLDSGTGFITKASGVFSGVAGILDGVRGSLEAWQQNLKAKTLLAIASAIGILTLSLVVLSGIDSKKLTMSLGAVTAMLIQLMAGMATFSKVSAGAGAITAPIGLIGLAAAILILATALSKLGKLNKEEIDQGLMGVTALIIEMIVVSRLLSTNSATILQGSVGLIAFSVALLLLTNSVKSLGAINPTELTNGLIAVGVMLAEIVAFMKLVDLDKMGMTKGVGLLLLAGSILVMSVAVEKFAAMDVAKLQQGLIALGAILAELALFTRLTGNGANLVITGIGMTILAAAMLILTEAITRLGDMSWEELAKGMAGMAGALLIIAAAVNLMPKTMIFTAVGMVVMAAALVILSQALSTMGGMSWEEIGKGLVALGGSLLILTVALYAMSGTLAGSFALLVAAGALAVLAPVLATLGSMALSDIGIALLALAGAFLVLGIAGYALTPVIPSLLGLGVSMMLIGAAAMLVGVGLMLFSMGLAAIAVSGAAAAVAIVAMISTILGIIPVIIKTLIDTIIIFAQGIVEATPVVGAAILQLLLTVLDIIIKVTPKLLKALTILLEGLIQLIVDVVPDFIAAVLLLLSTLLKEIAAKMPEFVQSGFDILIAFLSGIRDNIAEVVTVVTEIVVEFLGAVGDNLPLIVQAGWDLVIDFINAMADSVDQNMQPLLDAIGRLATNIISGLVTGITKGAGAVLKALKDIVDAAIEAIKKKLLMKSPSKLFEKIGTFIPLGLIVGIMKIKDDLVSTMEDLGGAAIDGMTNTISKINDFLNSNMDMNPTIRPVLDLSEVASGGKEIDRIMGNKAFTVVPAVSRVSSISNGMISNPDTTGQINTGSTISLVQNNYSPKALSRIEIYRQTKNQLITLKGLVKA